MLSIHPEVQHFVDEDETNYETDEQIFSSVPQPAINNDRFLTRKYILLLIKTKSSTFRVPILFMKFRT